jgi:hypothetical protein
MVPVQKNLANIPEYEHLSKCQEEESGFEIHKDLDGSDNVVDLVKYLVLKASDPDVLLTSTS